VKPFVRALALLTLASFFVLSSPNAQAHVSVIKTTPQYQSTIDLLPERIEIIFNSPLVTLGNENPNTITVLNPNGLSIVQGETRVEGATISAAIDSSSMVKGDYTVRYRVVSTDGHGVSGSYHFNLMQGLEAQSPPPVTTVEEHGFWHIHRIHVIEGVVASLLIAGWGLYRLRFAPRK